MIWRVLELAAPGGAGIGNENIELAFILPDRVDKPDNLCFAGHIRWNAHRAALDSGELIEFYDSLVDAFLSAGFPRGDVDFLCAGAEECCRGVKSQTSRACGVVSICSRGIFKKK